MKSVLRVVWRTILISRPIFWPSTFLVFLLGAVFNDVPITGSALFLAGVWAFPYSLWISAVNDLSDIDADRGNPLKGGLSGAKSNKSDRDFLINLSLASVACIVVATLAFSPNGSYLIFATIALVVPYVYSMRPVRLKERPLADSLSNGLFVTAVFMCGFYFSFSVADLSTVPAVQVASAIFLIVSGIHIVGALRDYTPDKKAGVRTIAVAWGQQASALLACLFFVLPLFIVDGLPPELRLAILVAVLGSVWLVVRPGERQSLRVGLAILLALCAALAYSILTSSWKSIIFS